MRRQGFTLVELLVATALIVLIMAVLSQAFVEGLNTFRNLKAVGDLQERLRTATIMLRTDLTAQHFEGSRKLNNLGGTTTSPGPRPTEGFFHLESPAPTVEGLDSEGIDSTRAIDHRLHFTIRATGPRRENWIAAQLPIGLPAAAETALTQQSGVPLDFRSKPPYSATNPPLVLGQWAEILYWLEPQQDFSKNPRVQATAGTTPLFVLRRRLRVLVQENNTINNSTGSQLPAGLLTNNNFSDVSVKISPINPTFLRFANSQDVTQPRFRSFTDGNGNLTVPVTNGTSGDDLVMSDVVSFEVRALFSNARDFPIPGQSVGFQFETVAKAQDARRLTPTGIYDTAFTPTTPGNPQPDTGPTNMLRIRALQITLRVYDYKTEQTRQVTFVQEM